MKIIKYFSLSLAIIVFTLIILMVLIQFTNLNILKPVISEQVKGLLGRDLQLNGDIRLKFIPLHLSINKVQFENASWAKNKNLIELEKINIELNLKPLISGKVDVKNITIEGVQLNLLKNKKGKANWDFEIEETVVKASDKNIKKESKPIILPFNSKATVNLKNIKLDYQDIALKQKHNFNIKNLTINNDINQAVIELDANYNEIDLLLNFHTPILKELLTYESMPLKVKGQFGDIKLTVKTDAPMSSKAAESIHLEFDIETDNLNDIEKIIKNKIPNIGKINLEGDISVKNKIVNLNFEKSNIGKTIFKGSVEYEDIKNVPAIKADLKFSSFDLNAIEKLKTEKTNKPTTDEKNNNNKTSNKLFSEAPLDLGILSKYEADIKIDITDIQHNLLELKTLKLNSILKNGFIKVNKLLVTNKRNETLDLKLSLDSIKNNKFDLILNTENIKLAENESLSKYLTGANTDISIDLKGEGESVKNIMASLDGRFLVKTGEGTIKDDILQFIGSNLLMDLVETINPISDKSDTSILECAVVNFGIKNGIATADKSIVMQTDKIQIISSGVIDFNTETLEFAIKPQAREGVEINLNSLASMVKLDGPIQEPSINVSLKDTAIVYSYFTTGGTTYLAKSLFDTATRDSHPCKTAELSVDVEAVQ